MPDTRDPVDIDPVEIEMLVPLQDERAATVRVLAASLAADARFSVDEIDDLRLAISEVFSVLVDAAPDGRASIVFAVGDGEVCATIGQVGTATPIELDELASTILHTVLDEFSVVGNSVRLVKRARETIAHSGT